MIYTTTSIKEVLARIVRNTRTQDTSYIIDMPEWIAEAMMMMKTKHTLEWKWKDVDIVFHKAKLPCGLIELRHVEHGTHRMKYGIGSRNTTHAHYLTGEPESITTFQTTLMTYRDPNDLAKVVYHALLPSCTSCEQAACLPLGKDGYETELGYLTTDIKEGKVRIHYNTLPLDEDEFPLIPDEENYKQAIYWYTRAMMIGAGYPDKVFNFEYCENKYQEYAAKAISRITYPSVEMMDSRVPTISRLLPDNFLNCLS